MVTFNYLNILLRETQSSLWDPTQCVVSVHMSVCVRKETVPSQS